MVQDSPARTWDAAGSQLGGIMSFMIGLSLNEFYSFDEVR